MGSCVGGTAPQQTKVLRKASEGSQRKVFLAEEKAWKGEEAQSDKENRTQRAKACE